MTIELLDEGGLDGKFKDTILSLREDQVCKYLSLQMLISLFHLLNF